MSFKSTLDEHLREQTITYLRSLLKETGGDVAKTARLAGRTRTNLYWTLRKHGVKLPPPQKRKRAGWCVRKPTADWPFPEARA